MKLFQSLLAKYMLIIFSALFVIQLSFLVVGSFVLGLSGIFGKEPTVNFSEEIEKQWHEEASQMQQVTSDEIKEHFGKWQEQYPEASMFWVDGEGELVETLNVSNNLPTQWTASYTAKFIKERYGGDPFTVIAFIGNDERNGFIVFEVDRDIFQLPMQTIYEEYGVILVVSMIVIVSLFILVSFLFFKSIRKRLLHLQQSMVARDDDGIPVPAKVKKMDEVGQLEQTFNEMVQELKSSKERERAEEQLRRELIANLSHDLRTPLTKIRAQAYSLKKESLSTEGEQNVLALERTVMDIDRLMENLMSYTLLMASKYKLERKNVDVVRTVRECVASWYPVFEKEGFNIDIDLQPFDSPNWLVDPIWLRRIMDNLLQNVLRHANSGRYVKVTTESTEQYDAIVITDKGKGLKNHSDEKGVGIGLSIVSMMVKGMELEWEIHSDEQGTTVKIIRQK